MTSATETPIEQIKIVKIEQDIDQQQSISKKKYTYIFSFK